MAFSTPIVRMPRWSTPVACTKLALVVVILAFGAACTAIYGSWPAFAMTLFSACFSLAVFGYFIAALSFNPKIYNKWVVLVLEGLLTVFWLISLILLAEWASVSSTHPRWIWEVPYYFDSISSVPDTVNLRRRNTIHENLLQWSSPLGMLKRNVLIEPQTPTNIHGQDAHLAGRVLAGISAALAGVVFALYCATLIAFATNFNTVLPQVRTDEEANRAPETRVNATNSPNVQPGTSKPPSVTAPLRVDTLPKDFEPKPQAHEHYLTPEAAAEAGIEPPTPLLKAQKAAETKGKERESLPPAPLDVAPVSPLEVEKQEVAAQS